MNLDSIIIRSGNHSAPTAMALAKCDGVQACAMEVAYLRWCSRQGMPTAKIVAGWTDSLACVCPTIGGFVRSWNDGITDDVVRTAIFTPELLDLLPDTRGDDALMQRRMWMIVDWDIRVRTPLMLRLVPGLEGHAVALESLPPVDSQARLTDARAVAQLVAQATAAVWDAAWDAARAAAWDAAWDAARDAAGAAARAAAWDAARDAAWAAARDAAGAAARAAAWDAARAAARDAAWDAARAAARSKLRPAVESAQASAVDLIRRMCALKAAA